MSAAVEYAAPLFRPRRTLGRTGFDATVLGAGDLADRQIDIATLVSTLTRALDAGINVVDTAPGYEDGYSEEIVGRAVRGRRDQLFIIDKVDDLDAAVAPQIDSSLQRLQLENVDAFVFHNLSKMETFERLMVPGGGFDQLGDAVGAGKMRFRGISSHSPEVLRAAIEAEACDVVMFPIGPFVDERYVNSILPLARASGVGTICFKTFGAGKLLGDTSGYNQPLQQRPRGKVSSGGAEVDALLPRLSVEECLHYTMTLDPDVVLLGMSFPNEQDAAFRAAQSFASLPANRMQQIRERARIARESKGPCWWNPDPNS